jgi:hypothetical protein
MKRHFTEPNLTLTPAGWMYEAICVCGWHSNTRWPERAYAEGIGRGHVAAETAMEAAEAEFRRKSST